MDCSTPGLPVHHKLLELAQTHVHRVGDAIQPSHPLSSLLLLPSVFPASGSFPISQSFTPGGQSTGASASVSVLPKNSQDWFPLGLTGWSPCSPRNSQESSQTPQFKSINSSALSFLFGTTLTSIHDYWKYISLIEPVWGFPSGTSGKEPACQLRRCKRHGFDLWVGKIPWGRAWQPTPVFLPGESHGQRRLMGYSQWSHTESDRTEATLHSCKRVCVKQFKK